MLMDGAKGRGTALGTRRDLVRELGPATVERLLPSRFHLATVMVERAGMP